MIVSHNKLWNCEYSNMRVMFFTYSLVLFEHSKSCNLCFSLTLLYYLKMKNFIKYILCENLCFSIFHWKISNETLTFLKIFKNSKISSSTHTPNPVCVEFLNSQIKNKNSRRDFVALYGLVRKFRTKWKFLDRKSPHFTIILDSIP